METDNLNKQNSAETVCADQEECCVQHSIEECRVQHPDEECGIQHSIAMIADGVIPSSMDQLAVTGRGIVRVHAFGPQSLAVIVYAARNQLGSLNLWIDWCARELNLTNVGYRSHLVSVGEMLNGLLKCGTQHYKRVFVLSHDKQVALTDIFEDQQYGVNALINFMRTVYQPDWSREELRKHRDLFMQRPAKDQKDAVQPLLPGFNDFLDNMIQLKEEDLREKISEPGVAPKALFTGYGLLAAAIEYQKESESPDTVKLQKIKFGLLQSISIIEETIARVENGKFPDACED